MNRRAQALIEALVAITISTAFFISVLGLAVKVLKDTFDDQTDLRNEVCNLSGKSHDICKKNEGFILINTLLQLTVLLFTFSLIALLLGFHDFEYQSLNWCFDEALQKFEEQYLVAEIKESKNYDSDFKKKLEDYVRDKNERLSSLASFQASVGTSNLPISNGNQYSESAVYNLNLKISPKVNFNLSEAKPIEVRWVCGAKKLCLEKRCQYLLVADKY